jgi:Do/DeqQ family serine protease
LARAVAVAAFAVALAAAAWGGYALHRAENPPAALAETESGPPGVGPGLVADIVAQASPAVAKIETEAAVSERVPANPFFNDPFFRQFFGPEFGLRPQTRVVRGLGSGFLVTPDGYILTNEHVIEGAQRVKVTLTGRDGALPARVVGQDRDLDLAVLKIDAGTDLPYLRLGNSDQIRVGDWVIAIGNPYGLDHTVTVGVVSAKGRPIQVQDRHYENLLQTDASINPGNSGGPLLDLQGEVIGINTAVEAQAQGIGFAIPSNTVSGVLRQLMEQGKIERPWLGVYLGQVTPEVAAYLGLDRPRGALVLQVLPNGPAAAAGLRRGDVILSFNGQDIVQAEQLVNAVANSKVGDVVPLTVWRNGTTVEVSVTLEAKP